jgi:hypothetical protein
VAADGAVIQLVTRCGSAEEFIERFARFTTETDVVVPALPHVQVGTSGGFIIALKDRSVMMRGQCEVTEIRQVAGAGGAPGAALMRLRLRQMDAHSSGIHLRLMERHAASTKPAPPPPKPPAPAATPRRSASVPSLRIVPPAGPEPRPEKPAAPAASSPAVSATRTMMMPRSPSSTSPPKPALVNAGPAPRLASTMAAVAPAPVAPEAPERAAPPPLAARAPGADFTLPANPLSDLDAADLASFVELTLLEAEGGAAKEPDPRAAVTRTREPPETTELVTPRRPPAPAETPLERRRRIARRAAPYAACVLGGLLLGVVLRPSAKGPVVAAPSRPPAPVAAPVLAAPPSAAPAPVVVEEIPKPATRDCVARVTTTPVGAEVFWGDVALGQSPIAGAPIACGTARVTFRRERYAEVTRTITAERGQDTPVDVRLHRPPARLIVTSSPPGALVKVNRMRFGATPREISTPRYEHVRVEVSAAGYLPWKKRLYLRDAESKVEVKLVPTPKARRTAAAPVRH